jgi:hypothetical protein
MDGKMYNKCCFLVEAWEEITKWLNIRRSAATAVQMGPKWEKEF